MPNQIDKYINKIICGDCLEILKDFPDSCADLILTDPPYGIGADRMKMGSGKHDWIVVTGWDSKVLTANAFRLLFRLGDNHIIWGGNYFTKYLPPSPHWLIWDKKNPNLSFAECELAWVAKGRRTRIYQLFSGFGGKMHPTEKPLPLMLWCVENYSRPDDLILDPFCGSGTTCVAAKMLGRKYIGIDISNDYCNIARQRLEEVETGVPAKEQRAGQLVLFPKNENDGVSNDS